MIAKVRFIDEETNMIVAETTYKPVEVTHYSLMNGYIYKFDIHRGVFLSDEIKCEYKERRSYEEKEKGKI